MPIEIRDNTSTVGALKDLSFSLWGVCVQG